MEWDPTAWSAGNLVLALLIGLIYWKLSDIEKNTRR